MRKDVDLTEDIIIKLERLAKKDLRKLKPFMEKVLIDVANAGIPKKDNQIDLIENIKIVSRKKKKK